MPADALCESGNGAISLRSLSGVLSSPQDPHCQRDQTSWLIEGSPGQRVNLTLLDFGAGGSGDHVHMSSCIPYGFLVERTLGVNQSICGGRSRERVLYTSATNSVEVVLISPRPSQPAFLVNFQGKSSNKIT